MSEPDYRSAPSPTNEGKGHAKQVWDSYASTINKALPNVDALIQPAGQAIARTVIADLIGFWVLWHLHGGFEGLREYGYSQATIYRKVRRFRTAFGQHPDEWAAPGITINPVEYWQAATDYANHTDTSNDTPPPNTPHDTRTPKAFTNQTQPAGGQDTMRLTPFGGHPD